MSYNPGGAGSSSVSGSTDVVLSNPANTEVLTYDTSINKWKNAAGSSGAVSAHEAAVDPHSTAKYAIMPDGGRRIFTGTSDPAASASDGDIWLGP